MARNTNQTVVPQAASALDAMKFEVANELGLTNYNQIDKGQLTSRQNGYVGGNITKRLVALGEAALVQQGAGAIGAASAVNLERPQ
ncbi:MAG: alpha/beta-type small acid-soluble spore protein [Peptococcaceae bacterium]|nr:alpha/beta-type small acid-soluble spore protein [Peptococcaceae bacterium]